MVYGGILSFYLFKEEFIMIIVKNAELFEKTNGEENELCFNPESKDLDVSNLNTSNMTNMGYMFSDCKSLTELDLSKWDTSNVINMNDMFSGCYAFKNSRRI